MEQGNGVELRKIFYVPDVTKNGTYKIQETLPQYFHEEVLQRNLGSNTSYFGTIKFQVAFNLAVVWMIVFVALSKGLRSYGKVTVITAHCSVEVISHVTITRYEYNCRPYTC